MGGTLTIHKVWDLFLSFGHTFSISSLGFFDNISTYVQNKVKWQTSSQECLLELQLEYISEEIKLFPTIKWNELFS